MISMHKDGEWLIGKLTDEEDGRPVGEVLRERWKLPRKMVHLLFQQKEVQVDGAHAFGHHVLKTGQTLALRVCLPEAYGIEPTDKEISILYEDDHVLVVNKPPGLMVHPTEAHHLDSLDHRVAGYFKHQGLAAKVRHIHRLDQDTSGAVMYAKHALAAALLDEALREQKIKRTYIAFVQGTVHKQKGTIRAAIGKDRHHPTRRRVVKSGEAAVTHYQVLEQYRQVAKVECRLETGKTHQIRVHLSHIGHPLLGDTLYGGKLLGIGRQALHAASLAFDHPFGEVRVAVESDWPEDFTLLQQKLRGKA